MHDRESRRTLFHPEGTLGPAGAEAAIAPVRRRSHRPVAVVVWGGCPVAVVVGEG